MNGLEQAEEPRIYTSGQIQKTRDKESHPGVPRVKIPLTRPTNVVPHGEGKEDTPKLFNGRWNGEYCKLYVATE